MSPIFRRAGRRSEQAETRTGKRADGHAEKKARLVTLIRKPGCHLCDDAQQVVERVCAELDVPWEQKDITRDERLYKEYWEQIPVVLVDGEQHTFWRVDEERLRRALA